MPFLFESTRRVVIKLGTGILTSGIGRLADERLWKIGEEVANLRKQGVEVILVSSGAIGLGMGQLGLKKRPSDMPTLQLCAAVGQTLLMERWQASFKPHGISVAQLLFTRDDIRGTRKRHVAAKDLIERALSQKVVPIINENDSISTEEIKFGDNDILSALVAVMAKADQLIILSRAPGLLDRAGNGSLVPVVKEFSQEILAMAGGTQDPTGRGGMITKLEAAQLATRNGCGVFIGSGEDPAIIGRLFHGEPVGTVFFPKKLSLKSKARWLAFFEQPAGVVRVDAGARTALTSKGSSLLAKGVLEVSGTFQKNAVVNIEDPEGDIFARGRCAFSSQQVARIAGLSTPDIKSIYPRRKRVEIVHRDFMVLL